MKSFRAPRYLERYEDAVFDTEQDLLLIQMILNIKKEMVLKSLLIILEKLLHLIGIMQDFQLISKLIN